MNQGIDYGRGKTNIDLKTGIRFGVIPQNAVLQVWADSSAPYYGDDDDDIDDFAEPSSYIIDDGEYTAECGDSGDIFITKSPYYTYAQFCSPCAPGACHLENPLDEPCENNKAYCFAHDWFDDEKAPYPVYEVKTGKIILPSKKD